MTIPTKVLDSLADQIFEMAYHYVPQGYTCISDLDIESLDDMKKAWGDGFKPYRVSSDYCDQTIYNRCSGYNGAEYDGAEVNMAFRAWHDAMHLKHNLTTSTLDEIELGFLHVDLIKGHHEKLVMMAETIGQTLYYDAIGKFPDDQAAFVERCYICSNAIHWQSPFVTLKQVVRLI